VAKKTFVFNRAATTETVTGLATGRILTFVVKAFNARGTGPPSAHSKPARIR
jgi:hypothetical protein